MTTDNSNYTTKEKIRIITNFFLRKLERLLEIGILLIAISTVIALYKGEKILKEADLVMQKYQTLQYLSYIEPLSVEEIICNYINNLEVPSNEVVEETVENTEVENSIETEVYMPLEIETVNYISTDVETANYIPTDEEREFAYCLAYGEAGIESKLGQTLVINVAINNMRAQGYSNLIEEFTIKNRYSSVKECKVYIRGDVVLLEDVPQSVKDAVDEAFKYDYSEKMLKEQADNLGITDSKYWKGGATYFYNPDGCSEHQNQIRENIKVKFRYGNHVFYRYWDK